MANRSKGYGLSADISNKIQGKYDVEQARQAVEWISAVISQPLSCGAYSLDEVHELLKDGVTLCTLINTLQAGSVKKINSKKMPFLLMENIGNFLSASEKYGVSKTDLFQTVDLYEKQNMPAVISTIHGLGRKAQSNGYGGAVLGPKESASNVREFTEEQLKAGQNVIGLQMGSNKGATQAGMSMGKTRHIID